MIDRGIFIGSLLTLCAQAFASDSGPIEASSSRCVVAPVTELVVPSSHSVPSDALIVTADEVIGQSPKALHFKGEVKVKQGKKKLSAKSAVVNHESKTLKAIDNVHYQDGSIDVQSSHLVSDGNNQKVTLSHSEYQMLKTQSRGQANKMELYQEKESVIMHDGTLTTCPKGDNSWLIKAKKIELDGESEWGSATNSVIQIAGLPVMWVPYLTFPLSDKRKSGLLFPNISSSSDNGLDYSQPVYWNIKENMDATITPRYMSKRGTQLLTEFRHLTARQFNQVHLEYLPSDSELNEIDKRYLISWDHTGHWTPNWSTHASFKQVSDDNYFNDLDSDLYQHIVYSLEKRASVRYQSDLIDANAIINEYDVFGTNEEFYKQLPRLNLNFRLPEFSSDTKGGINSEFTYFANDDPTRSTATRLHLEPYLNYSWDTPAASIEAETKVYQTFYQQEDPSKTWDHNVSRTIPSFRLLGQMNFERQSSLWGYDYTQTLEPKVQYLWTDYQDQTEIESRDSMAMQEDYNGLFRDRRFSGLDRIADSNQLTVGLTSRVFDQHNDERLRISMGQIFYLSDSKVMQEVTNSSDSNASAFALSLDAQQGHYSLHSEYQYSFERSLVETSNLLLTYQSEPRKLIQLSYHYSPEPLNLSAAAGSEQENTREEQIRTTEEVNQLGLAISWPIKENVQLVGAHYRDIQFNRSVESMVGIQYDSCCWAIRLTYNRQLNGHFSTNNDERQPYDSGINLQFEIRGFGRTGSLSDQTDLFRQSLFGYRSNYF